MKKRMLLSCVALGCAMFMSGCGGNQNEKIVKELYALLQSGSHEKCEAFLQKNSMPGLEDQLKCNRATKRVFGTVSQSKEPVTTTILKTLDEGGGKADIIAAKCDGTTLYFVIGGEKGKDAKILHVTTDESMALTFGK